MAGQHNFDASVNNRGSEAGSLSASSGAQASANLFSEYRSTMESGSKSFAPPSDYERGIKGAPNPYDKFGNLTHNDNFEPVDRGPLEETNSEDRPTHNREFEPVERSQDNSEPVGERNTSDDGSGVKNLPEQTGAGSENNIIGRGHVISERDDSPRREGEGSGNGEANGEGMTHGSQDPIIKWFGNVQLYDSKAGGEPS